MINKDHGCTCWSGCSPENVDIEVPVKFKVITDAKGFVIIRMTDDEDNDLGDLLYLCSHGARNMARDLQANANLAELDRKA